MINNSIKTEVVYIIAFIILSVLTGYVLKAWSLSFLLWSIIYIIWKWIELYYFYQWYINSADVNNVPLNSGIFEQLCSLVVYNKNKNSEILDRNEQLVEQFESAAQAVPYAEVLLNKKHEIKWANYASQQIFGIVLSTDKNFKINNIIRDPLFISLLKNDSIDEVKINHQIDEERKIHVKKTQLSNNRILLVARDISQQEILRNSRKAFVANASHELRTPLTVITGYLELLENSKEISPKWQGAINQAMQQANRMESIINGMLKLSSFEHERYIEDNDEKINMPVMLNRLINDVKNSKNASEHTLKANIDSELNLIGNEEEIVSICLNLMNNAIIHTPAGTTITIQWLNQNNKAQLWVSDNGQGINKENLTHLTERFYRVDNTGNSEKNSTGLGLAIVKQICENHNAKLNIESEVGKGSSFKIVFPESRMV